MANMIADSLRRYRFAEPFAPFELELRDGRRILIKEPEHVGWYADGNQLSYAADDDSFDHVALSDVVSIRPRSQDQREPAA